MSPQPWPVRRSEELYRNKIFRVRADWCADPRTGQEHPFWLVDCADWANVVARTEAGEYILVAQWRMGTRALSIELPGGIVDPGEEPAVAAARELLEETGWVAPRLERLGTVEPNSAINTNRLHVFGADGCRPARPDERRHADHLEAIEVRLAAPAELDRLVRSGEIRHSNVLAALHLHRLQRGL